MSINEVLKIRRKDHVSQMLTCSKIGVKGSMRVKMNDGDRNDASSSRFEVLQDDDSRTGVTNCQRKVDLS